MVFLKGLCIEKIRVHKHMPEGVGVGAHLCLPGTRGSTRCDATHICRSSDAEQYNVKDKCNGKRGMHFSTTSLRLGKHPSSFTSCLNFNQP